MVATIQKELADRIAAKPCTRDYSALSIWIQSQCAVDLVRTLPPTVFWPRPKVNSAILRMARDPAKVARINNLPFFHETVRALFFHRRKYLRAVVQNALRDHLTKDAIDQILAQGNFQPTDRIEQLPVERVIDLVNTFNEAIGAGSVNLLDNDNSPSDTHG